MKFNLKQLMSPTERPHLQILVFLLERDRAERQFWKFSEEGVPADA